jgi:hypothetical protein
MATVAEQSTVERREAATRWVFWVPLLFGFFALAVPSFSLGWTIAVGVAVVASAGVHVAFRLRRGYESQFLTALYTTFEVDLMCAFMTVFAWRVTRTPWWVLVVLAALVGGAAAAGYVQRRAMLQALLGGGPLGGLLAGLGGVGAAGGGGLGFAFGRSAGGWAAAVAILAVACYLALAFQALWLRVEEPAWEPRRPRTRRRR